MQEVVEFLTANPVQYLATVGADGKAKCRPFMFLMEHEGKLWFGTTIRRPCLPRCRKIRTWRFARPPLISGGSGLGGKAVFEDNRAVKEACMNIPMLKDQYQTADNPIFEVFYLTDGEATICRYDWQCAHGGEAVGRFIEKRKRIGLSPSLPCESPFDA